MRNAEERERTTSLGQERVGALGSFWRLCFSFFAAVASFVQESVVYTHIHITHTHTHTYIYIYTYIDLFTLIYYMHVQSEFPEEFPNSVGFLLGVLRVSTWWVDADADQYQLSIHRYVTDNN